MIVLTICSTRGGVGKTILTANLAGFLVDADIQPTLSSDLPLQQQAEGGLQQLITNDQILGTIGKTGIPGLHIVVSGDPEGSIKSWILHTPDGEVHMRYFLRDLQLGQRNDHA